MNKFTSLIVDEINDCITCSLKPTSLNQLSIEDTVIDAAYSSINYKDSLAVKKNGGIIRKYPMIPGIDLSGIVIDSQNHSFPVGEKVLVTGYGLGVSHTGGLSKIARVPSEWLVKLPNKLSLKQAMIFGTAGFTAALCIDALQANGLSHKKEARIVVSGASGGVGTLAIAMLKKLGYTNILAVSRKKEANAILKQLGASEVLPLNQFLATDIKPLEKQSFDFVIDTIGGEFTTMILPQLTYGGSIAICENAGGINLQTTVLPFILRNIALLGIDSVNVEMPTRQKIWQRLATDLNVSDHVPVTETTLQKLPPIFSSLQEGTHIGRTIVNMNKLKE